MDVVNYVHYNRFGTAVDLLKKESPDAFDSILKRLRDRATSAEEMSRISELKDLRNLRPCVDANSMLRIHGGPENAELPLDIRHPLILPIKHAWTRLIVLRGGSRWAFLYFNANARTVLDNTGRQKKFLSGCLRSFNCFYLI